MENKSSLVGPSSAKLCEYYARESVNPSTRVKCCHKLRSNCAITKHERKSRDVVHLQQKKWQNIWYSKLDCLWMSYYFCFDMWVILLVTWQKKYWILVPSLYRLPFFELVTFDPKLATSFNGRQNDIAFHYFHWTCIPQFFFSLCECLCGWEDIKLVADRCTGVLSKAPTACEVSKGLGWAPGALIAEIHWIYSVRNTQRY